MIDYPPRLLRAAKAYRMRSLGSTPEVIAKKLRVSKTTAARDIKFFHDVLKANFHRHKIKKYFQDLLKTDDEGIQTMMVLVNCTFKRKHNV